jgi:hypothetical protein
MTPGISTLSLDAAPHLPLVLVPRIRCLEGIRAGRDLENNVDDVLELDIIGARAHVDAIAGVEADAILRQPAQGVIERLDPHLGPFAIISERHARVDDVLGHEPGIVDLQYEAGIDDGFVFLAQRIGQGEDILLVRLVMLIPDPELDIGRRDCRQERLLDLHFRKSRLEGRDIVRDLPMPPVYDGSCADDTLGSHGGVEAKRGFPRIVLGKALFSREPFHGLPNGSLVT